MLGGGGDAYGLGGGDSFTGVHVSPTHPVADI